jgi:hypothetical protein
MLDMGSAIVMIVGLTTFGNYGRSVFPEVFLDGRDGDAILGLTDDTLVSGKDRGDVIASRLGLDSSLDEGQWILHRVN